MRVGKTLEDINLMQMHNFGISCQFIIVFFGEGAFPKKSKVPGPHEVMIEDWSWGTGQLDSQEMLIYKRRETDLLDIQIRFVCST